MARSGLRMLVGSAAAGAPPAALHNWRGTSLTSPPVLVTGVSGVAPSVLQSHGPTDQPVLPPPPLPADQQPSAPVHLYS